MAHCPITCPCRRSGDGVFVLACCIYVAAWSPVLFGRNFGPLLIAFIDGPGHAPFALLIWIAAFVGGVVLLGIGLRAALILNDDVPVIASCAVAAVGLILIGNGWYLPRSVFGLVPMLVSRGLCFAAVAAASANLLLALRLHIRRSGYAAAIAYEALAPERASEAEAVLRLPGVRKAVLRALHPDTHPDAGATEQRALTTQFQQAQAVLDRITRS